MSPTAVACRSAAVLGLLALFAIGYGLGIERSRGKSANDILFIDPTELSLGQVWPETDLKRRIAIRNTSSSTVHVTNIESTCRCTEVEPTQFTLAAGQTTHLLFELDLSDVIAERMDSNLVPFGVKFSIELQEPVRHGPGWKLHGTVRRPLRFDPPEITYAGHSRLVTGQTRIPTTVLVHPNGPQGETEIVAHCDPKIGTIACKQNNPSGEIAVIEFTPSTDLPLGQLESSIQVFQRVNGALFPVALIPVRGTVVMGVASYPESLWLGLVNPGSTHHKTIELHSLLNCPFQISGCRSSSFITAQGDFETWAPVHALFVTVHALASNESRGNLVVDCVFSNETRAELSIPVSYLITASTQPAATNHTNE
jgi:hypothetical protein